MENPVFQETRVSKAYLRLAMPLVLSMLVTLIYNLADTFFVAQTNDTNLVAGVALGTPVFTLLMALGNIFGQGGSPLISRLLGQQNAAGARRVSSFCFYATILCGIAVGAVMLLVQEPMVWLLGASEQTYAHASSYYFWLALGAPAVMLSFIHSNFLRSEGMSRESMIGTVGGAVVNIILDPIFISGLGLGATGAAVATVIGYLFSDLFFIVIVAKRSRILSMNPAEARITAGQTGQIFGIGIPAAVVNLMQSVSVVVVNQFLLPFGNDKIAAMGIVMKVSMIALLLLTGLAFGGQPLFAYYYGAGDKQRLRELFRFCLGFISLVAVVLTAGICLLAPVLIRVFMDNEGIVQDGAFMLRWQVITMVFVGVVLLMTIVFQSMGKVAGSFVLSISRQGVLFLLVLIVAYNTAGYTGIVVSQAVSDVLTALIAAVLFQKQIRKEFQ